MLLSLDAEFERLDDGSGANEMTAQEPMIGDDVARIGAHRCCLDARDRFALMAPRFSGIVELMKAAHDRA